MIHRLSGPNSSWKINKYTNPTISCHHLAWQTLQGGGYQIPSQQMFQRYSYLSPQMRVSVKWLASLKCKLLNYLICFHSVSERKLSSVRESRSCAHPCGLQDSNQLWRHKSGTLPGKLAPPTCIWVPGKETLSFGLWISLWQKKRKTQQVHF